MSWPKRFQNDGDKLYVGTEKIIKVQLLEDEPELYYTHYVNGKTEKCGQPDCSHCAANVKRNEKGKIKVRDMADNKEKLLAGSSAMFQALHEVVEMCGTRTGFIFALRKTGEKTSTRYHVTALPLSASSAPHQANEEIESIPF